MEYIVSFSGEHRFLSNFYPVNVKYEGKTYRSVEHAYQAAKTEDEGARKKIREAQTAGEAKRLGRRVKMSDDFEYHKVSVMKELLLQKFKYPELKAKLLATGNSGLIEGNTWGDTFWGVCAGVGENHLGKLLMEVRAELVGHRGMVSNTLREGRSP